MKTQTQAKLTILSPITLLTATFATVSLHPQKAWAGPAAPEPCQVAKDSDKPQASPSECYADPVASFTLSDPEIKDLREYMNIARNILTDTLKEARRLGGYQLHQRLLAGIQASLRESGTNYNLLLFRYALERAVVLDKIYTASDPSLASYSQAASIILLRSIRLAVEYYNTYDLPRLTKNEVPSPDWVMFARKNIGTFQGAIAMAPDTVARGEVAQRALGWTAKALNTSPNRRVLSEAIYKLSQMQGYLAQGARTFADAQQLLKEVQAQLVAMESQNAQAEAAPVAFPAGNYPAAKAVGPGPLFPLIKLEGYQGMEWSGQTSNSHSPYFHMIQVSLGMGPIVIAESGASTRVYDQVSASAELMASGTFFEKPESYLTETRAYGKVAFNGSPISGMPFYQLKMSAQAGAVGMVGAWIGFEKNRYNQIQEQVLRFGWGPGFTIKINGTDYVLVRGGLGGNFGSGELKRNGTDISVPSKHNGMSGELAVAMRFGSFMIDVQGNVDNIAENAVRYGADTSIAFPLHFIFGRDAIKLEGSLAAYDFKEGVKQDAYVFGKVGLSYLVRF